MFNNCPVHFIFGFSFFISFGNEVTKISCHFQAKSVQLIFYEKRKWDVLIRHCKANINSQYEEFHSLVQIEVQNVKS